MRICVFCSSSQLIEAKYLSLASELGTAIADRKWSLVTGGGSVSMMGAVTKAAKLNGGKTIGVIPQSLVDIEVPDEHHEELHVVENMRVRKGLMESLSDAFIILPGGLGTLEELFEMWVGRFLKFHNKPIVILDPFQFYNPLHDFIDELQRQGFVKPGQREIIHWASTIPDALDAIANEIGK
ncbi:MAG: hypothetical protein RL301_228 [Actinomycetota bacterium]